MVKKNMLVLASILLFLNIVLVSVNAAEEKDIEIDGDGDPEFVIHWRYGDFSSSSRADTVVNLIENALHGACEKC